MAITTAFYGFATPTTGQNPYWATIDTLVQAIENHIKERTLYTSSTVVGNIGTGTDLLNSYALPASTLTTNGWAVRVRGIGDTAANGATKTISFQMGGASILTLNPITTAPNTRIWDAEILITRSSLNGQFLWYKCMLNSSPPVWEVLSSQLPAQTESNSIDLKFFGAGTSNADIRQLYMSVELLKA